MSQTYLFPQWVQNMSGLGMECAINSKIGPFPHYPGPIANIGGLRLNIAEGQSTLPACRIPGVQPFVQTVLRPTTCKPNCLTNHCFEYGNTRFPPTCECDEKYDCRNSFGGSRCSSNCQHTCGTCNHNSNVIYY